MTATVVIETQTTPLEFASSTSRLINATFPAAVGDAAQIGDPVYVTGVTVDGLPEVDRLDITDPSKTKAAGVLETSNGTTGAVRFVGPSSSVYSGLTAGVRVYAGPVSGLTQTVPSSSGSHVVPVGVALSASKVLVNLGLIMRRAS